MKSKRFGTVVLILGLVYASAGVAQDKGLWSVYEESLQGAKYIDLTHVIAPNIPVWHGFGPSRFEPARAAADIEGFAKKGEPYSYEKHGVEATRYDLATDQLGTQLDPPAHWAPEYGFPKFKGGTGAYARYVAICPPETRVGTTIGSADAPLPKSAKPLHWDTAAGTRVR